MGERRFAEGRDIVGFFTKETSGSELAPISRQRIKETLEAESWSYKVDSDGDIAGVWDSGVFWFFLSGQREEILQVRGTWDGQLDSARLAEAERFSAEWNRDKLFPKMYPHQGEDGLVRVITEHTGDYEFGLTDQQLRQHVLCGVNAGCTAFEALNEAFPGAIPASD